MDFKSKLKIISDYLHYVALYAPNFPDEDNTSLQKSFEQIFRAIDDLTPSIKDPNKKQWIELYTREIRGAYERYLSGQNDEGERLLRIATEHFDNLIKQKTTKSRFAVDPSGNIGEFSKKNSS